MRPVRQLKPWKVGADQPAGEPFVADEGQRGPQRIGVAGVREQCGGYFAFPDLRAGLDAGMPGMDARSRWSQRAGR
jgi:hypothetical protein